MNKDIAHQIEVLSESTIGLLTVVAELKELTTVRLARIEQELVTSIRQLQQAVLLLSELATGIDPDDEEER